MSEKPKRMCPHCGADVNVTLIRDRMTFFECPQCATVGADSVQTAEEEEIEKNARMRHLWRNPEPKS
jgi:uncharacterized Zn finger protein